MLSAFWTLDRKHSPHFKKTGSVNEACQKTDRQVHAYCLLDIQAADLAGGPAWNHERSGQDQARGA